MDSTHYGSLTSEKLANENKACYEIVREIENFGINERQRWLIIHQLCLGMEDPIEMQNMVAYIKEVKGADIFITQMFEKESNNGPRD